MIRVLLADDNPVFRRGLRRFLEADGRFLVVGECGDGVCTVKEARRLVPDILLVDIRMPMMDGLQAAREVRTSHPDMHVIILTEYDRVQYRQEAQDIGCDGYLLKSLSAPDLLTYLLHVVPAPPPDTRESGSFMDEVSY